MQTEDLEEAMQALERKEKETAREYAFRVIKENIINLDIIPGSIVSENELAAMLGLSRTPVREALIELSQTQVVEILPQRGSRISLIDLEQMEEAVFLRQALETAAAKLICGRKKEADFSVLEENLHLQEYYLGHNAQEKLMGLDEEFHRNLFSICGRERTYALIKSMSTHFDRVRRLSLSAVKDIQIVNDHREILQAVKNKDAGTAEKGMTKHLERYKFDLEEIKKKYGQYFKNNRIS